jgi:hypothetical protein
MFKLFIQRSSPLKLLGQLKPNLVTMVLRWSPFKFVSGRSGYLYVGTLIPFNLKQRPYISSMYFSWKYGLRMGQHGFRKMSFQTLKT